MDENVSNGKSYIQDDVPSRPFVWFTVIFSIFCIVAVVVVTYFYKGLTSYHEKAQGDAPTKIATEPITPPGPLLQADPVKDMVVMDAEQSQLLASYGWVDKDNGVARIPIDKAIALTLEHSLVKAHTPVPAPAMP